MDTVEYPWSESHRLKEATDYSHLQLIVGCYSGYCMRSSLMEDFLVESGFIVSIARFAHVLVLAVTVHFA